MATRRERVILELEDQFTTGMARAAASAALLNRELDSLSRDSVRTQRSFTNIERSSTSFGRATDRTGSQIDRLSGRLRVLTDVATVLTPALSPIGGVIVPAISGLASQLGFAAVAGGTAVLAFQGVGDALKALDKAALDPTTENLEAANEAMQKLSPSAQKFATEIRALLPQLRQLRDAAAEGLFPGVIEGLDALEAALPRVERIVSAVSAELGEIAADTGASLASDRWAPFLDFIAQEAPEALADMADAAGNVAHSMANLWMAFDPLNDDFSKWLVDATKSLDEWSAGLSQTEGFQEFVAYIQENGPQVADTFGAIGNAVVQLVQATAPLGGPVLAGIEAFANAFAAIADSDLGTPLFTAAAALALFNRTMAITNASRSGLSGFGARLSGAGTQAKGFSTNLRATRADLALLGTTAMTAGARTQREMLRMNAASARLRANLAPIGKGAGLFAGLAIASTGAADGIGLTNTASLALMGSLGGAPGAVAGGLVGGLLDAKAASQGFADAIGNVDQAIKSGSIEAMSAQLAKLKKERADASNVTGVGDFFGDLGTQIRSNPIPLPSFIEGDSDDPITRLEADIKRLKTAMNLTTETNRVDANLNFLGQGFHATSTGIDSATQSADEFARSVEKVNAVLTGRSTFRDYQAAIDDFTASLAENGKTLDVNTEAGRKNQALLDGIAASAQNYAKSIDDPALRSAFLDNARSQFLKAAQDAGVGAKAARKLADDVGLLNGVRGKVRIEVDASGAVRVISELDRKLRALSRTLAQQRFENKPQLGQDFWSGGWTGPGSKYQPAGVVHADEYVFSKEATNGNVAYLDQLHRQLRGYADGGLVRRSAPSSPVSVSVSGGGLSTADVDRIAGALANARPMFGDQIIQPHNYSEFLRQQEQNRRLTGSDGVRRG